MNRPLQDKNKVQSVTKVVLVLEELAGNSGHMKLTDIAKNLGMPTSTVYRLLTTLLDLGYVNQDPTTGEYILGLRLLSLASVVLRRLNIRHLAYPFLEKLRDQTGETANLVVLDSDEVLYVEKVESLASVRTFSMIGKRAPIHATGAGKVLLADLSISDIVDMLKRKGMEQFTPHTIVKFDEFIREVSNVRFQGYALDQEECEEGVFCIAAPVRNHEGKTIASISISGPKSRLHGVKIDKAIETVMLHAKTLSKELGFDDSLFVS